jgi:hypothetical protein
MDKICKGCKDEFFTESRRSLYCSSKCKSKTKARKIKENTEESVRNLLTSKYGKIARKKNKKGEFVHSSTKSAWDYWQC